MERRKNTTRSFKETVGTATAGKRVFSKETRKKFPKIRLKVLHEAEGETGDAKLGLDKNEVKNSLDFLEIESKRIKFSQIGHLKPAKGPRTIIIDQKNYIEEEMLLN